MKRALLIVASLQGVKISAEHYSASNLPEQIDIDASIGQKHCALHFKLHPLNTRDDGQTRYYDAQGPERSMITLRLELKSKSLYVQKFNWYDETKKRWTMNKQTLLTQVSDFSPNTLREAFEEVLQYNPSFD